MKTWDEISLARLDGRENKCDGVCRRYASCETLPPIRIVDGQLPTRYSRESNLTRDNRLCPWPWQTENESQVAVLHNGSTARVLCLQRRNSLIEPVLTYSCWCGTLDRFRARLRLVSRRCTDETEQKRRLVLVIVKSKSRKQGIDAWPTLIDDDDDTTGHQMKSNINWTSFSPRRTRQNVNITFVSFSRKTLLRQMNYFSNRPTDHISTVTNQYVNADVWLLNRSHFHDGRKESVIFLS